MKLKIGYSDTIAMLVATSVASAPASAADLVFASWGGSYQDAQIATAVKPAIAKMGTNVKTDVYNGGIAQIRSQVQTNNVTWDVVDIQYADAIRACDEGLLEKIDPASLPAGK